MKKENNAEKGNVILLVVIAIVTMIIVVVGATFAYLASSVQDSGSSDINVTTEGGSDLFFINAGTDLSVTANLENFAEGMPSLFDTTTASVYLKTNSETERVYNYQMYLDIIGNDIVYSSGTCYPITTKIEELTSKEACGQGNIWATDGDGYACYSPTEPVANSIYNNETYCLTSSTQMWAPEETPELILDIFKEDTSISGSAQCTGSGKCVASNLTVVEGITNEASCTGDNRWVANIFEEGRCHVLDKSFDITTATGTYSLYDNIEMRVTNGELSHNYAAKLNLINFGHNQVVNGDKSFDASLTISRIIEQNNGD